MIKSAIAALMGVGLLTTAIPAPAFAGNVNCLRANIVLVNNTPYTRTARIWANSAQNNSYDSVSKIADGPGVKQGSGRGSCDSGSTVGLVFGDDIRVVVSPYSSKKTQVVSLDSAMFYGDQVLSITGLGEDLTQYAASKPHPTPSWYNIQSSLMGDTNNSSVYYANTGGRNGFLNNGQMSLNLTAVTDGSSTWSANTNVLDTLSPEADYRKNWYKLWTNGGIWTFTWYLSGPGSSSVPASN